MLRLISGLGQSVPEQKWLNVTEFSSYPNFPEFLGQTCTPKSLKLKFLKCLFHSLTHTEIPQFFVEWKAPRIHSPTLDVKVNQYSAYCQFKKLWFSVRPALGFCIRYE